MQTVPDEHVDIQARFDFLVTRRRARKINSVELTELIALAYQSEMKAATRVRAVAELAELRGVAFEELWQQL
jgi:hypothetical protein